MLSMTGFGKGEAVFSGNMLLTAEISSVNRKQLELRCNLPEECSGFEDRIRKLLSGSISRGAVQVRVSLQNSSGGKAGDPEVDRDLLDQLVKACMEIRKNNHLDEKQTAVENLLQVPGVVRIRRIDPESPMLAEAFDAALEMAVSRFQAMRQAEGENLKKDLQNRLELLISLLNEIEPEVVKVPGEIKQKLLSRIQAEKLPVDVRDESFLRELLFYTDRMDVNEEITRLRSHFGQFANYLGSSQPCGRSLDFLAQEMFREINTLGNKSGVPAISALVVRFKSELEKAREQIQNAE